MARQTLLTNAGVSSFTVLTPHCIIATRVSVLKISSTFATPGSPNDPVAAGGHDDDGVGVFHPEDR